MAQRLVWVRSGGAPERGALAFPIDSSSNCLFLDGIANYFGLDPASLTVGRVVLLKDTNGLSVMDSNEIRQASAGLGDGMSENTPIVFTGTSMLSRGDNDGQSQSLDACVMLHMETVSPLMEVLTFDSYPKLSVVPALTLDSVTGKDTEPEVIIFPGAMVRQIGLPVFNRVGTLRGIVVQVDGGKLPRKPTKRKLKSLHGVELHIQSVWDLDKELEVEKAWHTTQLHTELPETRFEFILQNQIVEYTFPKNFKGPVEEWEEQHPLESFSTGLPPKKVCLPKIPTKLLTKEEFTAVLKRALRYNKSIYWLLWCA